MAKIILSPEFAEATNKNTNLYKSGKKNVVRKFIGLINAVPGVSASVCTRASAFVK